MSVSVGRKGTRCSRVYTPEGIVTDADEPDSTTRPPTPFRSEKVSYFSGFKGAVY